MSTNQWNYQQKYPADSQQHLNSPLLVQPYYAHQGQFSSPLNAAPNNVNNPGAIINHTTEYQVPFTDMQMSSNFRTQFENLKLLKIAHMIASALSILIGSLVYSQASKDNEFISNWLILSIIYFGFKTVHCIILVFHGYSSASRTRICESIGEYRAEPAHTIYQQTYEMVYNTIKKRQIRKALRKHIRKLIKSNLFMKVLHIFDQLFSISVCILGVIAYSVATNKDTSANTTYLWFIFSILFLLATSAQIPFAIIVVAAVFIAFLIPVFICMKFKRIRDIRNVHKISQTFSYSQMQHYQQYQSCSICLENYANGETVQLLPCPARDHFHKNCAKKAISAKPRCPICRFDFQKWNPSMIVVLPPHLMPQQQPLYP